MSYWDIKSLRLGCRKWVAESLLGEAALKSALREGTVVEVEGMYLPHLLIQQKEQMITLKMKGL